MHLDTARDQYMHQSRSHSCKGTPSRIELLVASLPSRETSSPTGARATHGVGLISQDPFSLDGVSRVPKSPSRAYV